MAVSHPSKSPVKRITIGTHSVPVYWKESEQGWQAKWVEHGEVKRKFSRSLPKLRKAIRTMFASQADELDWGALTPDQKAVCKEVIRLGINLGDLARIGRVSATASLAEVLTEFLESKKPSGENRSERHFRDLSSRCRAFVSNVGKSKPISEISARQVEGYLLRLKTRAGKAVSINTRKNHRDSIQNMFNWARSKGYLPRHEPTVMEYIDRIVRPEGSKQIWEVNEMRLMLRCCPEEYVPWLALSAFAGIRTAELFPEQRKGNTKPPLNWSAVKLDRRKPVIIIPAETSKTGERRVIPIQPVLADWLRPYAKGTGQICPPKSPSRSNHGEQTVWEFIRETCGVERRDNALRHSYASYRSAIVGYNLTAEEVGNEPSITKKHYRDIVAEEDAEEWFDLTPELVGRADLVRSDRGR